MSGSAENTASSAFEDSGRREVVLDLATANRMLLLVRRIVDDVQNYSRTLDRIRPEQERLDRGRRSLTWPQRQRRYQIREEVADVEQSLLDALAELEVLGVTLLDPLTGQVGLPTLVNDKRAYFSWKPGEEGLSYWHFAGEEQRRPIPASWIKAADLRLLGKS
jgi:hypothetical protein